MAAPSTDVFLPGTASGGASKIPWIWILGIGGGIGAILLYRRFAGAGKAAGPPSATTSGETAAQATPQAPFDLGAFLAQAQEFAQANSALQDLIQPPGGGTTTTSAPPAPTGSPLDPIVLAQQIATDLAAIVSPQPTSSPAATAPQATTQPALPPRIAGLPMITRPDLPGSTGYVTPSGTVLNANGDPVGVLTRGDVNPYTGQTFDPVVGPGAFASNVNAPAASSGAPAGGAASGAAPSVPAPQEGPFAGLAGAAYLGGLLPSPTANPQVAALMNPMAAPAPSFAPNQTFLVAHARFPAG